ncbi:MAG: SGNH/GDSL hydrolase family protein [Deltaproteobacteria bacterium]|nr:SGNH/GDSL hydrolase family protein [Deltaproteobacteria bacterium]
MKARVITIVMLLAVFGLVSTSWAHHNRHAHKKMHGHDALMINLGASTTYGYTFDSSLLGLPFEYFLASNHHIPAFGEYLKGYFGVQDVVSYNFAVPGKTSEEVLNEQLPQAMDVLPPRHIHNAVFTVEGGGNDLRHFQVEYMDQCTSSDPYDQYVCIVNLNVALDQIEDNLYQIVSEIKAAVPEAVVIMQTQYNSLYDRLPNGMACANDTMIGIADLAFEGNPEAGHPIKGLNVRIREIAAELGVQVGDIAGYLYTAPGDLYMNPDFFGGDCTHLSGTWDGIPAAGIPGDEVGLGYQAILGSFVYALPVE